MVPRNPNHHLAFLAFLALMVFGSIILVQNESALATHHANQGVTKSYCASTLDQPVVYVSSIFDVKTPPGLAISAEPLNFAFRNYLVEEYDFKSSSNFPANCGLFVTLSQAEANKQQIIADAQRAKRQIVEVNWKPSPNLQVAQDAGNDTAVFSKDVPPPTHTFCAVGHESTMYFSAVFDTAGALVDPRWNDSFNDFLSKTYSAEGLVTCTIMNTVREAERNLKARVGGVRANNHKAVETGWKYDPTHVASTRPRPKPTPKPDDDPEPQQQRPAAKTPAADKRDFAAKEGSAALTLCQNDRVMSGAFDCYRMQRTVYTYRIEHAGDVSPEPLVKLLDKLDCSQCIIDYMVKMWAKSAAQSRGLQLNAADCAAERFLTNVKAEPYPSHAKKLFETTIAACSKQ